MINGVLVERTVQDVRPTLKTNSEGLKKVLEELVKQYKKQEEEMDRWKVGCVPTQSVRSAQENAENKQYPGCAAVISASLITRSQVSV